MAILDLYVSAFDAGKDAWTKVGTSPYLDSQNQPTDYVHTLTKKAECGDFDFTDSGKSSETINSVYLYIYLYTQDKYGITVFLHDGTDYNELTDWQYNTGGWVWKAGSELKAAGILDTWTKIDAAKIYVKNSNTAAYKAVDCAYLKIDYTAAATEYTIQKAADFRVLTENIIQKNGDFRVLVEDNTIQKAADFLVIIESTLQKVSDFRVEGEETIQKASDFTIQVVDNTIQKNSDFRVLYEGTIQKGSDFRILVPDNTIQKASDLRVEALDITIQKTADFRVSGDGAPAVDRMTRDWTEVIGSIHGG